MTSELDSPDSKTEKKKEIRETPKKNSTTTKNTITDNIKTRNDKNNNNNNHNNIGLNPLPKDFINFLTILPTLLFNFSGVLIAAYLVYYLRVRSNDALRYVRLKRPGAVQTRRQIECVKEFEAYFLPQVSKKIREIDLIPVFHKKFREISRNFCEIQEFMYIFS